MKTNFTSFAYAILLIVVQSIAVQANAQTSGYEFNFNSTPELQPGGTALAVGAKYKFPNVAASGVYAMVTIVSATGNATIDILDDNSTTKPEAFSPAIHIPAQKTGMVEFKIEFFNSNGTPKVVAQLDATAMDIDGNAGLHELDALDMGSGSVLSYLTSALEINVVPTGTVYLATNVAGIEYPGVDTTAKQVMFTLSKTNISSFTYKAGAINLASSGASRQKGIYFKGFNYAGSGTLAVKYSSFDAVVVDKSVVLKWLTEEETDNNHFEVERSFDGTNFTTVGIVLDGFANGTQKSYQYKDNTPELQSKSVVYYRLKQVDNNGKYTYTNTLVVKMQVAGGVTIQTTPNPFTENLDVRFTAAGNGVAQISIINSNGQQVLTKQSDISKGYNTIQLNGLSRLAAGMYIARVTMNGVVTGTQKIIKN